MGSPYLQYHDIPYYHLDFNYSHVAASYTNTTLTTAYMLLAVLSLATVLSFSYLNLKSLQLPPHRLQQITTSHAFATEAVQLAVVVVCVYNVLVRLVLHFRVMLVDSGGERCGVLGMAMEFGGVVLVHWWVASGVDLIEGRVLLGRWEHPYKGECFVLTRYGLRRLRRRWRCRRRGGEKGNQMRQTTVEGTRQGPAHLVTTKDSGRRVPSLTRRIQARDGSLAYLDLATDKLRLPRKRRHSPPGHRQCTQAVIEKAVEVVFVGDGASSLPTPPDSGRRSSASNRRVSWSPTHLEISPGGTKKEGSVGLGGEVQRGGTAVKDMVAKWGAMQ